MESSTQLQKRLDNAFSLAPGQRFYNRLAAASLEHSDTPLPLAACSPALATLVQRLSATLVFCCYRLGMLSRRRVVSLFCSDSLSLARSTALCRLSLALSLSPLISPSLSVSVPLALALSRIVAERHLRFPSSVLALHLRA